MAILFMLSTAPLAVTYSYAESGGNSILEGPHEDLKSKDNSQKERLRTFFTEESVDEKLEDRKLVFPENTDDEMNRILSLDGTSGWSNADSKQYQSGIVIFDGKSSKDEVKYWKISVNGSLNLSKGELNLEVKGKSISSNSDKAENLPKPDLGYRVIFSGNMTESDEKNQILIAFLNSTLENSEKNLNPQVLQIKSPTSEPIVPVDSNQKVRNQNLVF